MTGRLNREKFLKLFKGCLRICRKEYKDLTKETMLLNLDMNTCPFYLREKIMGSAYIHVKGNHVYHGDGYGVDRWRRASTYYRTYCSESLKGAMKKIICGRCDHGGEFTRGAKDNSK